MRQDLDVLIVGAGPTGLALAIDAARRGLAVRIVDRAAEPSRTSKALAVQPRTLEVLADFGLAGDAMAAGFPLERLTAYAEGRPIARVRFAELASPFPTALILAQSETEALMARQLADRGVQVERPVELLRFVDDGKRIDATLGRNGGSDEVVRSRWITGCDGAHSTVRHTLGIPFEGTAYEEDFILADVRVDWDLPEGQGFAFLVDSDLLAALPMKGERRYRLIGSRPEPTEADPTLDEVQALLDRLAPVSAAAREPDWLARFRLHRRIAPRFSVGRAFLLGDAAHIHSPVGGQGMNTGIQDAYNLAWKLGLVAAEAASPALLDTYHEERHPVAERVVRFTDLAFRVGLGQNALVRTLRRTAPAVLFRSRTLQTRAAWIASQLGIRYRDSSIVSEGDRSGLEKGPEPGDRAPDGPLRRVDGRPAQVFDLLHGGRHVLLLFGAAGAAEATGAALAATARAPRRPGLLFAAFRIYTGADWAPAGDDGGEALVDPGGAVHRRYGVLRPAAYWVRPDGHVAWRGAPEPEALAGHLDRLG